jgi:hypothetical protein
LNSNSTDQTLTRVEILTKAADYVTEHGLAKGGFYDRGAVCARGAINAVLYGDADECGANGGEADQIAQTLADHLGTSTTEGLSIVSAIGRWNDAPERTAKDVATALRVCAAELAGTAK